MSDYDESAIKRRTEDATVALSDLMNLRLEPEDAAERIVEAVSDASMSAGESSLWYADLCADLSMRFEMERQAAAVMFTGGGE